MPLIRVFLLTCRRPALLPRALASLRAQTCADWVCELHNDAPEDESPRRLLAGLGDPRITLHHHERNWGPVAAFNHAFAGGPEPYAALLEDDNWWEPDFLARALATLETRPAANVVWANLRLWRENADGTWTDTGRPIWQTPPGDETPRIFRWPVPLQCFDGLHSNGAMLYRAAASRAALVPPDTPFDIIEPARERLLPGEWVLLPGALANFALTRRSARSDDRGRWARSQLLVAASYLLTTRPGADELARLRATLRAQTPPATSLLFHLALAFPGLAPRLLRGTRAGDWWRFLLGAARHPRALARALAFRRAHPALWATLLAGARARLAENAASPAGSASPAGGESPGRELFTKVLGRPRA